MKPEDVTALLKRYLGMAVRKDDRLVYLLGQEKYVDGTLCYWDPKDHKERTVDFYSLRILWVKDWGKEGEEAFQSGTHG